MNNILKRALALMIALLLVVPAIAEETTMPGDPETVATEGAEAIAPEDDAAVEAGDVEAVEAFDDAALEEIGVECVDQVIEETAEAELGEAETDAEATVPGEAESVEEATAPGAAEPVEEATVPDAAEPVEEAAAPSEEEAVDVIAEADAVAGAEVAEAQATEVAESAAAETTEPSVVQAVPTGVTVDSAAGETVSPAPVATNVEKVAFAKKKNKKRTLKVGGTLNLGAAIRFTPKTEVAPLAWTSSDPLVASVDATGVVTGIGKGVATITAATTDGKSAQTKVRVKRNNIVVFFGDSLTKGGRWKSYFKNRKTVNMGIVGDSIEQINDRVGEVAALRPEKVFLEGGINSLMRESYDASLKAYETLLDNVKSQLAGVPVYVMSVLPISQDMEKYGCSNADIVKFNAEIEKMVAARGYTFINIHPSYVKNGVLNPKLTVDGLHLKKKAYKYWRKAIKGYVK